jgi:copper(I)-binding protein
LIRLIKIDKIIRNFDTFLILFSQFQDNKRGMMNVRTLRGFVLGVLFLSLVAGCAPAAAPVISVESTWGMPSMSMPTTGAFFMVIKNTGNAPDKLLSGTSPACGSIEVHETVMKADGTMGMNLLDNPLEISAGGQVELKSGGLHIMCIMKKDDQFKAGSKVDLLLKFEKAGEQKVTAEIRMQ